MSKKHGGHSEEGHGGDKPWVYFMIDCFFLVTQFFVITFKVKTDETLLPQRLPPGGTVPGKSASTLENKKKLAVHVSRATGTATYEFLSRQADLQGLNDMLAQSVVGAGENYQVRVSYDENVPFADVMAVFNACAKVKVAECGLIPLRGARRN